MSQTWSEQLIHNFSARWLLLYYHFSHTWNWSKTKYVSVNASPHKWGRLELWNAVFHFLPFIQSICAVFIWIPSLHVQLSPWLVQGLKNIIVSSKLYSLFFCNPGKLCQCENVDKALAKGRFLLGGRKCSSQKNQYHRDRKWQMEVKHSQEPDELMFLILPSFCL